jgi:hypothetical protein
MTDGEEILMVCAPADSPLTATGSVFTYVCCRCTKHVMIAPSGQQFIRDHAADRITIVCMRCVDPADIPDDGIALTAPSEIVSAEVDSARPNDWRRRN